MERDQKKRTRAVDGGSGGHRKKEKGKDVENDPVVVVPAPTEDEVDEFFAILRRMRSMRTAVKYFEKGKLSDPSPESGGGDVDKKKTDGGLILDLNTVPDDRE
ncbi:hypothetical protein L6452_11835 [Arctium lappa]|uniref:Uncharacterized protein n=1 Tax=Arctium lappa TaxID=4217 RepID=A0ACB9DQ80_ARCLA|nr:hypothetical protein L6452_11835 [Arctium lappa]